MLNSCDLAPAPGTFNATRTGKRFGVSHLLRTLGVLLVASLLACEPGTSAANDWDARVRDNNASAQRVLPKSIVRDSAGIRIVEYPSLGPMAPAWAEIPNNPLVFDLADLPPALRLEAQPFLAQPHEAQPPTAPQGNGDALATATCTIALATDSQKFSILTHRNE